MQNCAEVSSDVWNCVTLSSDVLVTRFFGVLKFTIYIRLLFVYFSTAVINLVLWTQNTANLPFCSVWWWQNRSCWANQINTEIKSTRYKLIFIDSHCYSMHSRPFYHKLCTVYSTSFRTQLCSAMFVNYLKQEALCTFVQYCISGLVSWHWFFAEVLVWLRQTLHLTEACVERHGGVRWVLGHVQICSASELLLDHQSLFQQLHTDRDKWCILSIPYFL